MTALVIQDRYEIIRRLAVGGMGEIFLAHQTGVAGFRRLVILKTLRPELAAEGSFLEQFLDEARLAATLNHPNIVGIYEVGLFKGLHFIAMEYIGGADLAALKREARRLGAKMSYRVAAAIVRDAAHGLDAAHHARDDSGRQIMVVHRDVSPQNIMVRPDGVVKVLDFGIAQAETQKHESVVNKIKGKLRYMSPEQISGLPLDGRTDQFSLGAVLWELCADRPLFDSTSPLDIFQRVMAGQHPRLIEVAPDVPPALDDVVERMLATDRDARFPRCADVVHALRDVIDATGGNVEAEVCTFVEQVAGDFIAKRVKDLTPQPVTIHGLGDIECTTCGRRQEPTAKTCISCGTSITALIRSREQHEGDLSTDAATRIEVMRPRAAVGQDATVVVPLAPPRTELETGSDAARQFLSAVESSGVLHGDRRLMTVLVADLVGWGPLVQQVAHVPMGAFAVGRLRNLLMRQLDALAQQHGGTIVDKSTDRVIAAFAADHGSDVERAARFAVGLHKLLGELSRSRDKPLLAHVGLAAGLCVVHGGDDEPMRLGGTPLDAAERLCAMARRRACPALLAPTLASSLRPLFPLVEVEGSDALELRMEDATEAVFATRSRQGPRRVLIADDSDVFRRIEEEALRQFRFTILHARNGAEALQQALHELPDLILLDMQMPVMDGLQVLTTLRRTPATAHIPVIIVSTANVGEEQERLKALQVHAMLPKPVSPPRLAAAVRDALGLPAGD